MKKEIPLLFGSPRDRAFFDAIDFYHYARKVGRHGYLALGERVVFCFQARIFAEALRLAGKKAEEFRFVNHFPAVFVKHKGKKIAVVKLTIGGSAAAAAMEEAAASGTKKFVITGSAGGISPLLHSGDFVVAEKAIRDEGTSYHYASPSKYAFPSASMKSALLRSCAKHGISPFVGATWTTDAPYRETVRKLDKYRAEGVLTVEMEAASLFAVAKLRKAETAAIFFVSDLLTGEKWRPHFHKEHVMHSERKILEVALDAITG